MARTVKVAVIGSGLAGLTAAYRLANAEKLGDVEFEVHLFEKVSRSLSPVSKISSQCPTYFPLLLPVCSKNLQSSSVGVDSHSVSLDIPGYEGDYRVDVPMRSFQGGAS